MADEPKKDHPEDIESILSDLDAILTDMGGDAPPAATPAEPPAPKPIEVPKQVETPKPVVAPKPIEVPKPVETPKPVEAPKPVVAAKPVEIPKPAEPPKTPSIELAPREGMIKPPEKKPEPPKPAPKLPTQSGIELSAGPSIDSPKATPAPVDSPKANQPPPPPPPPPPPQAAPAPADSPKANQPPQAAPAPADSPKANQPPPPAPAPVKPVEAPKAPEPAKAAETAKAAELPKAPEPPPEAPKEQIRRVAYIYTSSCAEVKTGFAAFLSQAARTISKKPLFLREVLSLEVAASTDPNSVVTKAQQVKAVAILAVVEDWPSAKVDDLSDACSRANLQFRAVAPADAQKKSTAVDVIVDMMLLPGEG